MAKIEKFTDLEAWQLGRKLGIAVYEVSAKFPKTEIYGLVSQLRRATISITSNIAEGFSRYYFANRLKFYYMARGSLGEVQSQLILARDTGILNNEDYKDLWCQTEQVEIVLGGLIRKTRNLANS